LIAGYQGLKEPDAKISEGMDHAQLELFSVSSIFEYQEKPEQAASGTDWCASMPRLGTVLTGQDSSKKRFRRSTAYPGTCKRVPSWLAGALIMQRTFETEVPQGNRGRNRGSRSAGFD
jgi:hypothetical protein